MSTETKPTFEGWAILELMGHRRLAGHISEAQIGGASFIRIDVPNGCTGTSASWCPVHGDCTCPEPNEAKNDPGCPLHADQSAHGAEAVATQFYSPSAVYCLTPTTQEMAMKVAAGSRPAPVTEWDLPQRGREIPARLDRDDEDEF